MRPKTLLPLFVIALVAGCSDNRNEETQSVLSGTTDQSNLVLRQKAKPEDFEPGDGISPLLQTRPQLDIEIELKDDTPEAAFRSFSKALAIANLSLIKETCIDRDDLDLLVRGQAFPEHEVRTMINEFETSPIKSMSPGDTFIMRSGFEMTIEDDAVGPDRKMLESPIAPFPLPVIRANGKWKVDPSLIIMMRQSALRALKGK